MRDYNPSPLISIIIPTYNYGKYLPVALESCLQQTYKNLEIIVIDDGSTDNTREIVERYGDRIVYIFQENAGVSAARNRGIESATGDFIGFLDADDYFIEDAIRTRLDILLKNAHLGAVITETYSKKGSDGSLSCQPGFKNDRSSGKFYEDLILGRLPFATCAVLTKGTIAKQFRFPVGLSNGEDVVYFCKIFFSTTAYYTQRPTAVTLWHEDSLRHNIEELKRQDTALVRAILNDPFYGGALEYLRKDFVSRRCLELFRKLYLAGEKGLARTYFIKAIAAKPSNILKIDYLVKFIKSFT
jgi:glycosyltransferase involved in cell wall biosynthesis